MKKANGGKILADCLYEVGVKRIFTVPGESFLAALDGLYNYKNQNTKHFNSDFCFIK